MASREIPKEHAELLLHLKKSLGIEALNDMKILVVAVDYGSFLNAELERILSSSELLTKLEEKGIIGVGSYGKLKDIMKEIGRDKEIAHIEHTESSLRKKGYGPGTSTDEINQPQDTSIGSQMEMGPTPDTSLSGDAVVKEKDLSWLASKMGQEWESFGLQQLGMTKNDIYHCKCDAQQGPLTQHIFNMLHKWKCSEGLAATHKNLGFKLAQCDDFDKEILEEWNNKLNLNLK